MTWRASLRRASFRGVPFFVEEAEGQSGRRIQVHEYPGRDEPFAEDLGRATGQYAIEAYVLGDQYFVNRDTLIRACEQPGPGRLVHPYLGELSVVCRSIRWSERRDEGRICRFDLEFVQAGERRNPSEIENTIATVQRLANEAQDTIRTTFADVFTVAGFPAFVANSAAGIVREVAATIEDLGSLAGDTVVRADLAEVTGRLTNAADSLVTTPSDLATAIGDALGLYRRTAPRRVEPDEPQSRRDVLSGLSEFADFEVDEVAGDTPARQRQRDSDRALGRYIRQSAAVETARALTRITWPSYDEAIAARERAQAILDPVIIDAGDSGDDDGYRRLQTLSAAVMRDIARRGADLTPLRRYRRDRPVPSLVLAHQLYQDAGRAREIVRRTGARHPAFMPLTGRVLAE